MVLSQVLFIIFLFFLPCSMLFYPNFPISSFMIAISILKPAILKKNVIVTRQPVTITWESGCVDQSDCKKCYSSWKFIRNNCITLTAPPGRIFSGCSNTRPRMDNLHYRLFFYRVKKRNSFLKVVKFQNLNENLVMCAWKYRIYNLYIFSQLFPVRISTCV